MAAFNNEIIIKAELRPCYYYGQKALFHKWVERTAERANMLQRGSFTEKYTVALIELENGSVIYPPPQDIKFIDNKFEEYIFEEER